MNSFFSSPQVFLHLLFLLVSHTCLGQIYFHDVTAATTPTSNDGAIALTAQGDAGPFTFSWSGPGGFTSSQQSIDQLAPGEYCVTVVNGIGCATTLCTDILIADCEPREPGFIDIIPACPNASDGSIEILDPPANSLLSWSNGSTGPHLTDLSPGSYCVTITDFVTRCAIVKCYHVPLATPIEITSTLTHSCYNSYSGAIELTVTGGKSSNYQYQWSHGKTGKSVYQLTPGYYCVTVTNPGSECKVTECFEINFKEVEEIELVTTTWNSCASEDGFDLESGRIHVFINAPGGDLHPPGSPYSFSWTPDISDYISAENWFAQMITDLPSGTYCLNASSADGCLTKYTCIEVPLNSYQINANTVAPSCENMNDGEIIIDLIDELPSDQPYTIEWSTGNEGFHLQNLEMGEYAATISSQNGCERILDFNLSPEIELTIDEVIHVLPGGPLGSIKTTVKNPNNHNINLLWSNGQTTDDIFNLNAGTYTVTLTSDSGCEIIKEIEVSDCPAPVLGIHNFQPIDEDKNQLGEISFAAGSPQPGYGPFTFSWTGPPGFIPPGNTQDLLGLTLSGEYCLTATNTCGASTTECVEMNNCEDAKTTLSNNIYFQVRKPCLRGWENAHDGAIILKKATNKYKSLFQSKEICGNKIIVEWPNNSGIAVIDANGKVSGKTKHTISKNAPPGYHIIKIKDECGCEVEQKFYFGQKGSIYGYSTYPQPTNFYSQAPELQDYSLITSINEVKCCGAPNLSFAAGNIFGLNFIEWDGISKCDQTNNLWELIYIPNSTNPSNPCDGGKVAALIDGKETILGEVFGGEEIDISNGEPPETTCTPNVCVQTTGCLFLNKSSDINLPLFPIDNSVYEYGLFFESPKKVTCDNPIYDPEACNGNITYEFVNEYEDAFGIRQCNVNVLCQNETNSTVLASNCPGNSTFCYVPVEGSSVYYIGPIEGPHFLVYRTCSDMVDDAGNCHVYDEDIDQVYGVFYQTNYDQLLNFFPDIIECPCTNNPPNAFMPDSSEVEIRSNSGTGEIKFDTIILNRESKLNTFVYPVPSSDLVYLKVISLSQEYIKIEVFDATGKLMLSSLKKDPLPKETFSLSANKSSLKPGIYFIKIQDSSGNIKYEKIIISNKLY